MDLFDLLTTLVVACVFAIPLGVSVWALLDAARRPQWAWALAGRSQVAWMAGILFGVGISFAIAGAVTGGILGERLTRPEGADAQKIRDAHQVRVDKQLTMIDRQLEALGYEATS